jgi:hypothetical protein
MNRPYNSWPLIIPVILLGLIAALSRLGPTKPEPPTAAQLEQRRLESARREMVQTERQWMNHLRALEITKQQLKTAKHVLIVDGHKVPSDTDESDSWFKKGKNGGIEDIKSQLKGDHQEANR